MTIRIAHDEKVSHKTLEPHRSPEEVFAFSVLDGNDKYYVVTENRRVAEFVLNGAKTPASYLLSENKRLREENEQLKRQPKVVHSGIDKFYGKSLGYTGDFTSRANDVLDGIGVHGGMPPKPPKEDNSEMKSLQEQIKALEDERDCLNEKISQLESARGTAEILEESVSVMERFNHEASRTNQFKKYILRRAITIVEHERDKVRGRTVLSNNEVNDMLDRVVAMVKNEARKGDY